MRTTLKRGVGRGADLNGTNGNGHAVFPPAAVSSVVRYGEPPKGRTGLGLLSRFLVGTLLVLVALALAIGGGALLWYHTEIQATHATGPDVKIVQKELNVKVPGQATIALVVGYDQRAGAEYSTVSRSDTVMLIRADPVTKTISLLSFPRDLTVPIYCPAQSYAMPANRINSAYADCGAKGTLDTVKHLTGLPIQYMITVNFHGFKEIVDKLGGIWMDIDRRYYHVNNGSAAENYANINIQPGYQLLTGEQALDFVRYRHTDDDYHRIARQQEFVRALKQQFSRNFDLTKLPSIIHTVTSNVSVYGDYSDSDVLSYAYFAATLPGGHFFQPHIEGITGTSQTYAPTSSITQAVYDFTHPDLALPKAANAAALGIKQKPKTSAPPPAQTTVTVLNGNGVAGSAANGSYLLRQKGYQTVLPPGGAEPNAPTQSYFHSAVYYDPAQTGAKAAAAVLAKLLDPADVAPLPKDPKLRALDPGSMLLVVVGQTFHNQLVATAQTTPVLKHVPASVHYDGTTGLDLLQPFVHRAGFRLEVPTVIANGSVPDTLPGDKAARLYWMDEQKRQKAIRLVFSTGTAGDYWGIEETDMPDPPILDDKSFQRDLKGREFQLYYDGSSLHMVVLRVHDRSYWVVNTLLDSLSNETMLAIAKGLKPLPPPHK
jgi:LCP family protein required for cell wall assembly